MGGVQLRRKHGGFDKTLLAARALDVSTRGGPREDILHGRGGPVDVVDDELDPGVVPEEGELPGLGARDGDGGGELGVVVELAVHRVGGVVHLLRESHELVVVVDAKDGERKLDTLEGARWVVKVGQVGLGATLAEAAGPRGVHGADKVLVDVDVLEVLKLLPRAAADDAVHLVAVDVEVRGDGGANLVVVVRHVLGVQVRELDSGDEGVLRVKGVDVTHAHVLQRGVVGENLRERVADVVLERIRELHHDRRHDGDDNGVLVAREVLAHLGHHRLGFGSLGHRPSQRGVDGRELIADVRRGVRGGGAEILNLANHALTRDALGDELAGDSGDEQVDDGIDDKVVGGANRVGEHRLVPEEGHLGSHGLSGDGLGELLDGGELGAAAAVSQVDLIGVKVRLGAHLARDFVKV